MDLSIVQKIYQYEAKNGKRPSLVIIGEPQYHQLEVIRYNKKSPNLFLSGGVFIESIMGIRLIKVKTIDGVYFAEEQVLK